MSRHKCNLLHCIAVFKKRAQFFALLFIAELIIYILAECLIFNSMNGDAFLKSVFNVDQQCNGNQYPTTYYRKHINETGYSFYVYNIAIGTILLRHLSQQQIANYTAAIQHDLLQNIAKWHNNKTSPSKLEMRRLYNLYYNEFHSDSYLKKCNESKQENDKYTTNFFEFIHYDTPYIGVNANESLMFYDLSYYNYDNGHGAVPNRNQTRYRSPKLFAYTVSVAKSGSLRSLEFRIGEINGVDQHDYTKHLLLNGVHNHVLWSGECYYIYDYKYKRYTMILDTASGHFMPKISAIPYYLEYILVESLFPEYNITHLYQNDSYKPLIMIGYTAKPWHEIKKVLFPVSILITQRDKANNKKKRIARKAKMQKLNKILANESCSDVITRLGERIVGNHKNTRHTMETIVPYIIKYLRGRNIGCKMGAEVRGWTGLNNYKSRKKLLHLLHSY